MFFLRTPNPTKTGPWDLGRLYKVLRSATPAGLDGRLLGKLYTSQLYTFSSHLSAVGENICLYVKFQLECCSESDLFSSDF